MENKEVWIVYVLYQYDGYEDTEVYETREKACDAADQLIFEFKQEGYVIADGFVDKDFSKEMIGDCDYIRLDKDGEVEITVEKKIVR